MSKTDTIADMLTIVRNGARTGKEDVQVPYSKMSLSICNILKQEEYIENFKEIDLGNIKKIKVYLKYKGKKNVIRQIRRVSRPGRRIYVSRQDVPSVLHGHGVAVVSTSRGILTDKDAKAQGVGGEVMAMVW